MATRNRMYRRALLLLLMIMALTVPVVVWAGPARADTSSDILGRVNSLRSGLGIAPMAADATLTTIAQQWAAHMAATGILAHNPGLATQAPPGWTKIGENIGDAFSLDAVYNALVASPDHYLNMIDTAYNRSGVGVAVDTRGQVWLAQEFGAYPPPTPANFTLPTNGSVIFSSSQAFSWNQAPGAEYYGLTIGSTQGGYELLSTGPLPANSLSYTVAALPPGMHLWARIYTYAQGQWIWNDSSFSVAGPSSATFIRPTNGATNVTTNQPFSWTAVPNAGYYGLTVGVSLGGYDLVSTGPLPATQTSYTVPSLPSGQTLWARIYSYIDGSWLHYSDVSFTAAASTTATFTRPLNGATNVDTTQPFTWTPVAGAGYYGLIVGTTPAGYDLVSTGPLPSTQTSYSVPALPIGRTLYARVYSYIGGSWLHYSDITFTAAPRS